MARITSQKSGLICHDKTIYHPFSYPFIFLNCMIYICRSLLESQRLDEDRFISTLTNFISESEFVQNNPTQGLVPQEQRIVNHISTLLDPYLVQNGGKIEMNCYEYVEGRPNVILKFQGTGDQTLGFLFIS